MPQQDAVIGDGRAYPILKYRDTVLNPHPNRTKLSVVALLLGRGQPTILTLEPGDATRYDLIVCPVFRPLLCELLVARTTPSGEFRAAHTVGDPLRYGDFIFHEGADAVAINDGWEREFFRWWLRCLWTELGGVR